MRALSAQPTVSPTLIHHLQRNYIQIKPNVRSISGSDVTFENGEVDSFDTIIMCTGYKIGLDFLHPDLKNVIFKDADNSILNLFKGVFHPALGSSLGFIGFAQPQSGGLLTISEIQARWFVHLMMNDTKLPSEQIMKESIDEDIENAGKRFHNSSRHTIQQDPILYNDEVIRPKDSFC
jgi:dimethylaniline monooxygenase (N-oxide forming)